MSSTNQSPFYKKAEAKFLSAQTDEEKLEALEEMIRECPKHKSSENMLANLRRRKKKLLSKLSKSKKAGATKKGIKKENMQAVIVGKTNSGKSSLLATLTNAQPRISATMFTTTNPVVGMMNYATANMQIIENPAVESEFYDKGLINTADTILIVINQIDNIKFIEDKLGNKKAKRIIVFNNKNNSDERKISETLKSKKYNFVIVNFSQESKSDNSLLHSGSGGRGMGEGLSDLREKILLSFNKIRIYTKEPGKEKTTNPIILNPNSTVRDAAEKILHGFSEKIKQTKIWGPSSKFPGQSVGLKHQLQDLDVVEFRTK